MYRSMSIIYFRLLHVSNKRIYLDFYISLLSLFLLRGWEGVVENCKCRCYSTNTLESLIHFATTVLQVKINPIVVTEDNYIAATLLRGKIENDTVLNQNFHVCTKKSIPPKKKPYLEKSQTILEMLLLHIFQFFF